MKRNFYNAFYKKTGNRVLAELLSVLCYGLWLQLYCIQRLLKKSHAIVDMDTEHAMELIARTSPKPEIGFNMGEQKAVEDLDLTVIVPVYNYRTVLKQCLDSIRNQNTKYRYEMIFVDDGSTDGSADILKMYETDTRVTVYRQENCGISAARNLALNQARGRYIMFVDCDDFLEPDAVELLLERAYGQDCDIVEGAYYTFSEDVSKRRSYIQKEILLEDADYSVLMTYTGYPWAKVYKRELFRQVRFPEKSWFEDTLVKMILFRECGRYSYLAKPVYGYRKYEGNYTETQVKSARGLEHYWMLCWMVQLSEECHIGSEKSLYLALLYHLGALYRYRIESVEERIQQAAFVAGASLLESRRPERIHGRLPFMYRELEKAYLYRDFAWWKLICRFM